MTIIDPSSDTTLQADDHKITAERRTKLAELRRVGYAFPNQFKPRHRAAQLAQQYGSYSKAELEADPISVCVAGRMILRRLMGRASFATLQDGSGQIQLYLSRDALGQEAYEAFKSGDLGDIIGTEGVLMKTKTGELSIASSQLCLLSKSLRPLPEKFHGLTDPEQKYRQRYVDLMINEGTRTVFLKRSQIIQSTRRYLVEKGYLEVETPMMHPIPGGATAKPFITHHNALNMTLFLRIAPELYLKRLLVGGFERVFEINRNFRNEGISSRHNPEFTMLEFYEAYADYQKIMTLAENIISEVAQTVSNRTDLHYQGQTIDLTPPFQRLNLTDAIVRYCPQYAAASLNDASFLEAELTRLVGKPVYNSSTAGLQLALFEATTEEKLWQPTFIVDYPIQVSPLARSSDTRPEIAERFELFIAGKEIANGYSELNDPEDQARRFTLQAALKNQGDKEAMHFDADYIRALEYGMPPAGGCGIGMDRLVMLLTDAPSIRDVILFPQLRQKA